MSPSTPSAVVRSNNTSDHPSDAADVIVVGAGPGGSTTAAYLAAAGLDVLLLEKSAFPREKVCGDGLTPRAVKELIALGIPTREEDGWIKNQGLRVIGGGVRLQLPWPEPGVVPRLRPGPAAARLRRGAGAARREGRRAAARAHLGDRPGPGRAHRRVVGVTARQVDDHGKASGPERTFTAPVVVAADGNSSRLSLALGLTKRDDRPMGVAVRTYFTSPRHDDDWLESWLELWAPDDKGKHALLPGYGWIFGVGDGTSNVGLGALNTTAQFGKVDYRDLMKRWVAGLPAEWGYTDENQVGPIRGAALPMGFNRQPHYTRGLVLVGDAGGMVNPFNGEGIAYAMESGRLAADVLVQALSRTTDAQRERALQAYPAVMKASLGGYYTLGRLFVSLIGHPEVMRIATRYGMPRPLLMRFVLKLLANLAEPRGGDAMDRIITGLSKIAPAA